MNEALARTRARARSASVERPTELGDVEATTLPASTDVEQQVAERELQTMLETAIDALPDPFRVVFMLRDVEQLSIAETLVLASGWTVGPIGI